MEEEEEGNRYLPLTPRDVHINVTVISTQPAVDTEAKLVH